MNPFDTIIFIAIAAIGAVLAVTVHEAAHGYAAKRLGDKTAFMLGRVTLNPIKHIDPIGTVLLPGIFILGSLATNSPLMFFGYAKPVPINTRNFANYRRDMNIAVAAGPGSNLMMALVWAALATILAGLFAQLPFISALLRGMQYAVSINLIMFAFNLLPIPPLDGGRILVNLLPYQQSRLLSNIEPYGFFIVIGLIFLQIAGVWINLVTWPASALISALVTPLRLIFN
jgi:Zn-dependent protease